MNYVGLSSNEIKKKQERYGKNILPEEKSIPAIKIFLLQFINPLVYILCIAALISLFLQKYLDVALILSVVIVNAFMGFFQENKTQKTLLALKKLIRPIAKVMRGKKRQEIEVSELVPEDIVFVAIGDKIPADGKIIEKVSFLVDEAILTGESEPIVKNEDDEVYMGTIVSSGRAVMKVVATGIKTRIGKIAETLEETEQPITTLQIRLKKMTHTLIYISIFFAILIFSFGFFTGREFWEMIELSAIILVAIIPEALLIVITLVLVLAMRDSLKRKALIRKILAVETLGSVTTICTDKTGTLTEGKMKIVETDFGDFENSCLAMCLCNDRNDSVEIAIWKYLKDLSGFSQQEIFDKYERVFEIPFGSEHKFMATINHFNDNGKDDYLLLVKGAPEIVLNMSNLSEENKKKMLTEINIWAEKGLKVLALAYKKISKNEIDGFKNKKISELEWGGSVGIWDPPRKEVKETLEIAKKSGLKIKVVTGDYYRTAVKIMESLGMKISVDEVLRGDELEKMNDKELKKIISKILLFARVTPEQKLRIVNVLQEQGEIVAMTGDGVNDASALKKSNIGIVVGDASEVAKETADLILLDNNFKTIISAIESGRLVFENIKKIILFILSNSFAEVVVIIGALILGWPLPLTIIQILWLHLLCDGPEDFILGFEPKEKETMLDGPKRMDEPIFGKFSIFITVIVSLVSGLVSLGFFWYFGLHLGNLILGQTMVFMSLAFSSVVYIFSCRTLRKPFWKYENFWSNKWLFVVVGGSLFLAIIITYFPPTQKILGLVPLNFFQWILLSVKAILLVLIIEISKLIFKPQQKFFNNN